MANDRREKDEIDGPKTSRDAENRTKYFCVQIKYKNLSVLI